MLVRELFSRTLLYAVPRIVPAVASLVSVAIFARSMGVDSYSALAIAYAAANATSALGAAWLSQSTLRFFPGKPKRESAATGAVREGMIFSMVLAAVSVPATLATIAHGGFPALTAFAAGVLAAAMVLQTVLLARVMVHGQVRRYWISELVRAMLLVGLAFGIGLTGKLNPLSGILVQLSAVGGSCLALLWGDFHRKAQTVVDSRDRHQWLVRLFRFGFPMSLWMGLMVAQPLLDRTILLLVMGAGETGRYAANYDIYFRASSFLFAPLLMVFHPSIMHEANTGNLKKAHRRVGKAVIVALLLGPVAGGGLAALTPVTARLLGITPKAGDALLIFMLAFAGWLWQSGVLAQKLLEISRKTFLLASCMAVAVIMQAGLIFTLAPRAGSLGAAVASALAAAVYLCLVWVVGDRSLKRPECTNS